jgi:CspA family cold shock protein
VVGMGRNGNVVQPGAEAGSIAVDEGQDVFVHFQAVQDNGLSNLKPGQRVVFDVQEARQGHRRRAVHLRPSTLGSCDRSGPVIPRPSVSAAAGLTVPRLVRGLAHVTRRSQPSRRAHELLTDGAHAPGRCGTRLC